MANKPSGIKMPRGRATPPLPPRTCAYEDCNVVFQPTNTKNIYHSKLCAQRANYKPKAKTKRKKEYAKDKVCTWCKQIYHNSQKSQFCCGYCTMKLSKAKSKLLTHYMFEGYSQKRIVKEIRKLYALGKDYRITE
jgi:hypothetical protein